MPNQVRVRRERPSTLTWAIALTVTMLAVYIITLSAPSSDDSAAEETAAEPRITQELVLEGVDIYIADMGVYDSEQAARIAAAGYAVRGGAGYVLVDESGAHVLGAGYAAKADAERIAERLSLQESIETSVFRRCADGITLRITASPSAVSAISAADAVLRNQLKQAETLALQIDRGELNLRSARTLCALSADELDDAANALRNVSGALSNPICSRLLALLAQVSESLRGISSEKSASSALSGSLRCCHVGGTLALIDFLNGLR